MRCLLVVPRWSELESLLPASGRPHLDLLLNCLGFGRVDTQELELDASFDPTLIPQEYQLILVQGEPGSRLKRSLLSNLGLSLWLDEGESDQLRVVGARPIYSRERKIVGFGVVRRGRLVVFVEVPIWSLKDEMAKVILACMQDEKASWRGKPNNCWMVDGSVALELFTHCLSEAEFAQCQLQHLPDGDFSFLSPVTMQGAESLRHLHDQLGGHWYADEPCRLEELIGQRLRQVGWQVTVAESCTAGLVTARLAAVPGSSAYLTTGLVTYSNLAKQQFLYVPETLIQRCGAVSPEVALAMARGALRATNTDLAVGLTGIAGPDGGSLTKPVGTVYLAAVARNGNTVEYSAQFPGNRDRIRFQASQAALHLIRRLVPV